MDKVLKAFMPMTETAYYILLSLAQPRHGYGVILHVADITNGRIKLGSGTVYGTLTKLQHKGVISVYSDEERRTVYEITDIGKQLILAEIERVKEIYTNAVRFEGEFHA